MSVNIKALCDESREANMTQHARLTGLFDRALPEIRDEIKNAMRHIDEGSSINSESAMVILHGVVSALTDLQQTY